MCICIHTHTHQFTNRHSVPLILRNFLADSKATQYWAIRRPFSAQKEGEKRQGGWGVRPGTSSCAYIGTMCTILAHHVAHRSSSKGLEAPLTCWFDIEPVHHADEIMCLKEVEVLEAHVLQLLLQLAVAEVLWDAIVSGVLLDADKEEGGLEPLQSNGDVCYGAEDHFCIEVLN